MTETWKTLDGKNLVKSGDIGQVVLVGHNLGDEKQSPHGVTLATRQGIPCTKRRSRSVCVAPDFGAVFLTTAQLNDPPFPVPAVQRREAPPVQDAGRRAPRRCTGNRDQAREDGGGRREAARECGSRLHGRVGGLFLSDRSMCAMSLC